MSHTSSTADFSCWYTPVKVVPIPLANKGRYEDEIVTLGSCFSESIGGAVAELGYKICINPYGTLYNPFSIAGAIDFLLSDTCPHMKSQWEERNGLYHSWFHHGRFSAPNTATLCERIEKSWHAGHRALLQASQLWITFGSTWVYRLKQTGTVVANCHKFPASYFERKAVSLEDCVEVMAPAIDRLRQLNPTVQLVCTVSPIRYVGDGLVANSLSKSTLRLLCEHLCHQFSNTFYFPAYEIVIDELRDYRFYGPDLVHPSATTVTYLTQRFLDFWSHPQDAPIRQEVTNLAKLVAHRPLRKSSCEAHKALVLKRFNSLKEKYPFLNIDHLISSF